MDVPAPLGPADPAPVSPRSSARVGAWILVGLLTSLSLALALAHSRQERPALDLQAEIPFDAALKTGSLPNGLTFYIRQNSRPAGRVLLRLAVKAGSLDEADDQQGLAHFLEHMAFNGSEHFKPGEFISYFESIGARLGPHVSPTCCATRRRSGFALLTTPSIARTGWRSCWSAMPIPWRSRRR
jgi:hypothetical protein